MAWYTSSRGFAAGLFNPRRKRRVQAVAAATAAGLVVTLAQVPYVAAAVADTPPAARDDGLLSEAEAAAQAARTGQETEVSELTSPTTRVVALADGSFRAQVSVLPARVQNSYGSWDPVDTTLIRDETGQIVPTRPAVEMAFSGGGDAPLARIADGGRSLAVSWPGGDLPEPELTGSAAIYRAVIPGVDVVAQAGVTGFSTFIVVASKEAAEDPAVRQLALDVDAEGIQVQDSATGGLTAKDGTETVFTGGQPLFWDSEGATDAVEPAFSPEERAVEAPLSAPLKAEPVELPMDASNSKISLAVPESVLTDPATVWPLVLDPSITRAGTDYGKWTMIWSNGTTIYNSATEHARVGYDGWSGSPKKSRSYFKMDIPLGTLQNAYIQNATFTHRQVHSPNQNCATATYGPAVQVYRTDHFTSATTWSNRPALRAKQDENAKAHGHEDYCPGYDLQNWNVTSAVNYAVDEGEEAVTFMMLSADETERNGWRKYDNSATTFPEMTIEYYAKPPRPKDVKVSSSMAIGTTTWTSKTAPTLSAYVQDATANGAGSAYGVFKIFNSAGTEIWSKISSGAPAAGGTASVAVPSGILQSGSSYKARAWASADNGGLFLSSDYFEKSFSVDTTPPAIPTDLAATVAAGAATLTWTAPAGTGSAVNSYRITSSPSISPITIVGSPPATERRIDGLANGVSYTFQVAATDVAGTGATASVSATPRSVPDVVPGVSAETVDKTSVRVRWTTPASNGSAVTQYTLSSTPTAGPATIVTGGSATSGVVTGLTTGTSYTFTVGAINAAGTSGASEPSNAATPSRLAVGDLVTGNASTCSCPTGDEALVTTLTPALGATVTDTDAGSTAGGPLDVTFEVWPQDVTEAEDGVYELVDPEDPTSGLAYNVVTSGTLTGADAQANWTVPTGTLSSGEIYAWRAKAADSVTSSPWSQWRTFYLDTSATATNRCDVDGTTLSHLQDLASSDSTTEDVVTTEEALARYAWQDEFMALSDRIETAYPDQFAGSGIDSGDPDGASAWIGFRGATPAEAATWISALEDEVDSFTNLNVTEAVNRGYSDAEINAFGTRVSDALYQDLTIDGFVVTRDVEQGEIDIEVADQQNPDMTDATAQTLVEAAVTEAGGATITAVAALPSFDLSTTAAPEVGEVAPTSGDYVYGGGELRTNPSFTFQCTSGFTVELGGPGGKRGVATAGHCPGQTYFYANQRAGFVPKLLTRQPGGVVGANGDMAWYRASKTTFSDDFVGSNMKLVDGAGITNPRKGVRLCTVGRGLVDSQGRRGVQTSDVVKSALTDWSGYTGENHERRRYTNIALMEHNYRTYGDSGGPVFVCGTGVIVGMSTAIATVDCKMFGIGCKAVDLFTRADRIEETLGVHVAH